MSLLRRIAVLLVPAFTLAACADSTADSPVTEGANEINAGALKAFDCKTQTELDGAIQHVRFTVKHIENNHTVEVLDPNGRENRDYAPIAVEPEGRVTSLNENMGVSSGSRFLRISGDSDGFYLLDFVLYKNSDYTRGYLKIYGAEGDGGNAYAKVSCEVTTR